MSAIPQPGSVVELRSATWTPSEPRLFSEVSDKRLRALGVAEEELAAVRRLTSIEALEAAEDRFDPLMGSLALKFLCLTAARSGEVRGMTWNEIDLENRIWTIPKERMKANREHRIPLPDAAVQILQDVPHLSGCYHVFFSPTGKQLSDMSISAVLRRMDENAVRNGTKRYLDKRSDRPAVPHGLRSTFRDWAAEQGIDHVLAELALAHTVGNSVERAYRRTDMVEKRRDILEQWAGFLGA